jgi:hypothetical protein
MGWLTTLFWSMSGFFSCVKCCRAEKEKTRQNPEHLKLLTIADVLISIAGVIPQQCQHLKHVLLESVVEKLVIPAQFTTF